MLFFFKQILRWECWFQDWHVSLLFSFVYICVCSAVSDSFVAFQAPLTMGFSRPDYWSKLPFPPLGDLPHPGIQPLSPALAGGFSTTAPPREPWFSLYAKWREVTQSCLTLCNPMDCSPSASSIHGIFQARILKWVAISFSEGSSRPRDWTWVFCLQADSLLSKPPGNPTWQTCMPSLLFINFPLRV